MTRIAAVIVLESDDPLFTQTEPPEMTELLVAVDCATVIYVWALMEPAEAAGMVSAHSTIRKARRDIDRSIDAMGNAYGTGHRRRRPR